MSLPHRRSARPLHLLAAAISTLLLACALCNPAAAQFANPILPKGADPWVFQWGGQYFYTGTRGSDIRVSRSPWLQNVGSNPKQVWNPPAATPYGNNMWAPEIHRLNGKWYLYYAADDGNDVNHRMYVLEGTSQDPQGSYKLKGQISIPDNRWSIDGTVMEYAGKSYFIWSGRQYSLGGNDYGSSQSLYIAAMSNPWTLSGQRIAISSPTYAWERHGHPVNEGPEILRHGNDIFLTYSASAFETPDYAIGALKLTGDDPLSPRSWTKLPQPLFTQANGVSGTGHASFVKSPDGAQDWIVYHARTSDDAPRDVRIQRFTWNADGTPNLGQPVATGQTIPSPTGTPTVTFIPNLSFERGGKGWLDDFHATGDAGAIANDGSHFPLIKDGDGPMVGYLGANVNGSIHQDIGPITQSSYTLSVGLAISDDQKKAAVDNPGQYILRLISVGLHPGGSANDADQVILAERAIDSRALDVSTFRYFDVTAQLPDHSRDGTWLRVELDSAGPLPAGSSTWQVKLDRMTLTLSPPQAATVVPEPSAVLALVVIALTCIPRLRPRFFSTIAQNGP